MRDEMWTLPLVAGALLLICGMVIGAWATDRIQGSELDAYLDGRETESYAAQLAICHARSSRLERFRPDVTEAYREVGE